MPTRVCAYISSNPTGSMQILYYFTSSADSGTVNFIGAVLLDNKYGVLYSTFQS